MDYCILLAFIVASVSLNPVSGSLRCIECTHIEADETVQFDGSDNVYYLLRSKFNKACSFENPNDRNLYNDWLTNYQQQQQTFNPIQPRYDISETICSVIVNSINKCRLLYGEAEVYLPTYNYQIVLTVAVRDCIQKDSSVQDVCYQRDTNFGYHDIRNDLNNKLAFVSPDVKVRRFTGRECFCSQDRCLSIISGSRTLLPSIHVFLAALLTFFVYRRL